MQYAGQHYYIPRVLLMLTHVLSEAQADEGVFVVVDMCQPEGCRGHSTRFMWMISDAKRLECRVHMYAYDGVHGRLADCKYLHHVAVVQHAARWIPSNWACMRTGILRMTQGVRNWTDY